MTRKEQEIAEALKIHILSISMPEITPDAPAPGKARNAWLLAEMQNRLDEVSRFIELEIQPHFPVEITQTLKPNMLFVKAETDEAAAELYKIPGCHVSKNGPVFSSSAPVLVP